MKRLGCTEIQAYPVGDSSDGDYFVKPNVLMEVSDNNVVSLNNSNF